VATSAESGPTMLQRTVILGAIAGAVLGELYLLALTIAIGDWESYLGAAVLGAPFGALAGVVEGLLALAAVLLLGLRRIVALASLVGGLAAAAVPLAITFHAGWPRAAGGSYIGIGLSCAAFVAAAGLTWPVLTGWPRLARASGRA
jgi:hypothetical protein